MRPVIRAQPPQNMPNGVSLHPGKICRKQNRDRYRTAARTKKLHRASGIIPKRYLLQFRCKNRNDIAVCRQNRNGARTREQTGKFRINSFRGDLPQKQTVSMDTFRRRPVNRKRKNRGKADGTHQPQAVLPETLIRISHARNDTGAQMFPSAEQVHKTRARTVRHGIYGKVTSG
ncbi:unknown [Clostridium sp. CAG:448]|nr:unknown [Clostridium sp. CAG:448]